MSWPSAMIWIALIVSIIAVPVFAGRKGGRSPAIDIKVLSELKEMRTELAALRIEVAELDRVLKSVE